MKNEIDKGEKLVSPGKCYRPLKVYEEKVNVFLARIIVLLSQKVPRNFQ